MIKRKNQKNITTLQNFAALHHTSPSYTSLHLSTLHSLTFTLHYPLICLNPFTFPTALITFPTALITFPTALITFPTALNHISYRSNHISYRSNHISYRSKSHFVPL